MKKVILFSLLFISACLSAQNDFHILYGPYLQGVTEKEATVVWVTTQDAVSWVELAPDDGSHFYAEERPQYFQTNFGKKVIGKLHKVTLTGLEKGTSYRYRIYSKEVTAQENYFIGYGKVAASAVYQRQPFFFKTLDCSKPTTHFTMVNDIHEKSDLLERLLSHADKKQLDFVLFNGDMVTNMFSEQQLFDGFLAQASSSFAAELPFFMARGNHETRGLFSTEYINYFPTPTGQPYYSFQQGPAFFIVLDAGEDKPDSDIEYHGLAAFDGYRENQVNWLKETLASEAFRNAPVKIVIMHVPPIRSTWHGPIQVKKHFIPLLNEAGIDLMLSAHLHRHFFIPKGEEGCNFPILINANTQRLDVSVEGQSITLRLFDEEGKAVGEYKL
ncbi:metallophosphoesterase family protein [Parabacteroides sp. OttesenSCG-928-N08]|nr:metallophosphoesterase family protein [Parabacteroides sp. OttesenSCG-928-N08]